MDAQEWMASGLDSDDDLFINESVDEAVEVETAPTDSAGNYAGKTKSGGGLWQGNVDPLSVDYYEDDEDDDEETPLSGLAPLPNGVNVR